MTFPGAPCIYYGDEIGMRHLPDVPNCEGAYAPRKGARTPMQWTPGRNKGFSTAAAKQLYFPTDPAQNAPNVEAQDRKAASLLNRTRKLVQLRREEPALAASATFDVLYAKKNKYPLVYLRRRGKHAVLVALNPADRPVSVNVTLPTQKHGGDLLAGQNAQLSIRETHASLRMKGRTYAIYKLR